MTVSRSAQALPFGARGLAINLKAGTYSNISFTDSTITDSVYEGATVEVRGWPGDSPSYTAPNDATLNGLTMSGLTLKDNGGAGLTIANQVTITSTPSITNSRIVDNGRIAGPGVFGVPKDSLTPVNGIFATYPAPSATPPTPPAGIPVSAENNWFGCNTDPIAVPSCPGCTVPATNAIVDADPWLVAGRDRRRSRPTRPPAPATIDVAIKTNSDSNPAAPLTAGTAGQLRQRQPPL